MRHIARFSMAISLSLLFLALSISSTTYAQDTKLKPSAELAPQDVVRIVVDALKTNRADNDDDGIDTVFRFASPGNKSATGPLPRFKQMIKRGFGDMLNHISSEFGEMEIKDDKALQAVWLTSLSGTETGYVFQLGKQAQGEFTDMWMTESVWPIGKRKPKGQSI